MKCTGVMIANGRRAIRRVPEAPIAERGKRRNRRSSLLQGWAVRIRGLFERRTPGAEPLDPKRALLAHGYATHQRNLGFIVGAPVSVQQIVEPRAQIQPPALATIRNSIAPIHEPFQVPPTHNALKRDDLRPKFCDGDLYALRYGR